MPDGAPEVRFAPGTWWVICELGVWGPTPVLTHPGRTRVIRAEKAAARKKSRCPSPISCVISAHESTVRFIPRDRAESPPSRPHCSQVR